MSSIAAGIIMFLFDGSFLMLMIAISDPAMALGKKATRKQAVLVWGGLALIFLIAFILSKPAELYRA